MKIALAAIISSDPSCNIMKPVWRGTDKPLLPWNNGIFDLQSGREVTARLCGSGQGSDSHTGGFAARAEPWSARKRLFRTAGVWLGKASGALEKEAVVVSEPFHLEMAHLRASRDLEQLTAVCTRWLWCGRGVQ